MKRILFAIIIVLSGAGNVAALEEGDAFDSGASLSEVCKNYMKDTAHTAYLLGYITGAADAESNTGEYCLAKRISNTDLPDFICQKLTLHPEDKNVIGANLIAKYLAESFPCQTNTDKNK